ncbi:tyrosinase family protein [Ascidiimonas sp. W6]|uniref:tyrosinase family protein n=1 Tax=Ascidiimonas meishanensis TaxID=3128903 RepID=UPI0030ED1965
MKNYQLIFMGLLLALLNTTDAFAGRRVSIWSLTSSERTTIRTQIMNYLNSDIDTSASGTDRYNVVNTHGDNDAYIHNYNQVFLGWHRRYIAEMETYVMANISSSLRTKCNNLLPFWSPTTTIPSAFSGTDAVLSGFDPIENTNPNSSGNYNFNRFFDLNFCNNYPNDGQAATYCATQTARQTDDAIRPIDKFAADLECEHNSVHDTIGGVMGDSLHSPAAAIFWIWHAFVDELYWDYEVCNPTYSSIPYSMNFDNLLDNSWYVGSSNRFGRVQVTTQNGPQSGSRHLTMDVTTNTNFAENEAIVNLNLAGMSNVSLNFWWKEWSDENHDQDGVYFSDGGPFVKVYDLTGGSTTWAQQTLNVSTLAANNGLSLTNTFKIKFQQYDNYAITTDGMAFDGVSITGTMASGHCTDFETGWDYWFDLNNSGSDDIDWTRHAGSTTSSSTGPTGAASGTRYLYLEASGNGTGYPSKRATLQRQIFNSSLSRVSFNYHMYGSTMGTLALQVSNSTTSGYTQIWSRTGDQGNSWRSATVTIPSTYLSGGYYLRLVGTTGSSWRSDMAVDNICFSTSSGRSAPTLDDDNDIVLTEELTLDMRGYPNPFSQSATIEYTLPEATKVVLTVRDITGREIKRLVNGISQEPGVHRAVFHAGNIPDGVYLYTLEAQGIQKTGKLILQR